MEETKIKIKIQHAISGYTWVSNELKVDENYLREIQHNLMNPTEGIYIDNNGSNFSFERAFFTKEMLKQTVNSIIVVE